MSVNSNIQWTDKSWNPTTGCTRVSQGCVNCYAFTIHDNRHAAYVKGNGKYSDGSKIPDIYAKPFTAVQLLEYRIKDPLGWKTPVRIFVDSMSDLFHVDVPDDYLVKVWDTMRRCPHHVFQILTKRPRRMRAFLESGKVPVLQNVWLGVSVENQDAADLRIPELAETPAAVRFLSCEPLLGPVDVRRWTGIFASADPDGIGEPPDGNGIDWIIIGGESGHKARPVSREWIHNLVLQGKDAGAAVFVKQLGSVWAQQVKARHVDGSRDTHGSAMQNWPKELQVRAFPRTDAAQALLAFTPANLLPREAP